MVPEPSGPGTRSQGPGSAGLLREQVCPKGCVAGPFLEHLPCARLGVRRSERGGPGGQDSSWGPQTVPQSCTGGERSERGSLPPPARKVPRRPSRRSLHEGDRDSSRGLRLRADGKGDQADVLGAALPCLGQPTARSLSCSVAGRSSASSQLQSPEQEGEGLWEHRQSCSGSCGR